MVCQLHRRDFKFLTVTMFLHPPCFHHIPPLTLVPCVHFFGGGTKSTGVICYMSFFLDGDVGLKLWSQGLETILYDPDSRSDTRFYLPAFFDFFSSRFSFRVFPGCFFSPFLASWLLPIFFLLLILHITMIIYHSKYVHLEKRPITFLSGNPALFYSHHSWKSLPQWHPFFTVIIGYRFLIISFLLTYGRKNFNKNKPVLSEQWINPATCCRVIH